MTSIQAAGTLLTANAEDRVLEYLLLPFGEQGRTSAGRVTASKGVLSIPEQIVGNLQHDRTRPVAKSVRIVEEDRGIVAAFRVANTTAGSDLLAEAAEGLRTGISVEIDDPVIRGGALVAGALSGAGFVTTPAFPSAQLVAEDAGELPPTEDVLPADATKTVTEALKRALEVITENTDDKEEEADVPATEEAALTAARTTTPATVPAGTLTAARKPEMTSGDAFKALAQGYKSNRLEAALANVTHDDGDNDGDGLGEIAAAPAWLGEVWRKAPYVRRFIPLVASGAITNWRMTGFKYVTTPTVAPYAGNKTEIPSQGITAEPYTLTPKRWAVGADIDRRFVDFGDQAVIQAWFEFAANSYAKVTDEDLLDFLVASATEELPGDVPAGIDPGVAAIADGALALVGDDLTPTFAIVGTDLYRSILLTPHEQVTAFLGETAGFREGGVGGFKILPSADAALTSKVLVGDGSTVRYREFGGGAPLRVEAEHLSHGGRDVAVFGYSANELLTDEGLRVLDLADETP
ncbi:hypothetical protein [Cellulosimicrobium cellulans]|uniref:phage major capsid protein n=1 Tax=Cellulosimicrobium cellulans TaxID=1710 RepID=UPI00240522A7|nr:hypothetical protein [Cellulosimicrobium cellulans]MDF9877468.1 hypothetical protein [Cellulosimicrobium cellulans]